MTDTPVRDVTILPDMHIPLPDGTILSARVWMPAGAQQAPVPAILEYLPYRKSDGTAARDHGMHAHFAAHGYACLRVDRRGCGESGGLFDDEYSPQELSDGVDIIHWIAAQRWCSGRVGVQGISWGGFNALQLAALAPEPLKAVISIGATLDRFHGDIHYKGGIQLSENIGWAATIMSWLSTPPDPALRPDTWRETWLNRLEHTPFLAERWGSHTSRDAYWRHGSVCENPDRIKAPVLVFAGQHDGYRNAPMESVRALPEGTKAVLGPWSHKYPNISTIEPSIDYLGEALRWWDQWLKDTPTGVATDPAYRAYVMQSVPPDPSLSYRPGTWVGLDAADCRSPLIQTLHLGQGRLGDAEPFCGVIEPDLRCGEGAGEFFPFGFGPGELPDDQAADDARSLCFDGPPLDTDWTVLGAPSVALSVASDSTRGQIIARLCDLRPDGSSTLIALAMLDLRFRDGFAEARPLTPAAVVEIALPFDQTAYCLPKGHRLRLALSSSYWPYAWPEAGQGRLTITAGRLTVPLLTGPGAPVSFDAPRPMDQRKYRTLTPGAEEKTRSTARDGTITLRIHGDHGMHEDIETGLITGSAVTELWTIHPQDPQSARAHITWDRMLGRGDWQTQTRVTAQMHGRSDHFDITQTLEASEGGAQIFKRVWRAKTPR